MAKEKIKIKRVTLQTLAQQIADELQSQEFITSDAYKGEVNREYAVINVYETLLWYFEPID